MKLKRAAAYVRVSSFDQNTEAQETALREYVQRRGWTLHKFYRDEGISGTKVSRPALDELLRDCRRKAIDVVVVWKLTVSLVLSPRWSQVSNCVERWGSTSCR